MITTVIIFLVILSILVLAHEFGHFVTARKAGMRVYEFGLGFPPRAFGFYKDPQTKKWILVKGKGKSGFKETMVGGNQEAEVNFPTTLYSFNWLPLGGFVKIKGENGEDANESDSFGFHKPWKRFVVLIAGVTMNVLLAGVILAIGFMIGLPTDISGDVDNKAIVVDPYIFVEQVSKGSPAEEAGIEFGDKVLSVDSNRISNSEALSDYVRTNGPVRLSIAIEREGERLDFKAIPALLEGQNDNVYRLGLSLADVGIVRFPWYVALYKGFIAAFISFATIFVSFFAVIKNLIMGNGLIYDISGPVGIASFIGKSARMGINYLISTTAMLSITLAVINILPIPALDGGRAFFVVIEKIIRRPLSMKYEQLAHTIGFALLMGLILVVTVRDIFKLF